jgi:predicted O-methyltransferase YrrM
MQDRGGDRHRYGPLKARHIEPSYIVSPDDDPGRPSDRLLEMAIAAIKTCRTLKIDIFDDRSSLHPRWYEIWPGEHYRLLAALVKNLNPKVVVEVGTDRGMGTLCLMQELQEGVVHTFDVIPWDNISETWFGKMDFDGGRVVQHIADLAGPENMQKYADLFGNADLVFVDAPKDGTFEPAFIRNLAQIQTKKDLLVVFDDIRLLNMLLPWREISRPKLDLVSFGHWTGTGLVDWNGE